jgi:repressor LexA
MNSLFNCSTEHFPLFLLMAHALTDRQQQLLDFLREAQTSTGVMPSSREIQQHFGFASQTAAMDLLRALERKGVIQRMAGKARAVVLPKAQDEVWEPNEPSLADLGIQRVPLHGSIAAGMPQDGTGENEGCLHVDLQTLGIPRGTKTFALRVRGESMINAHIMPGDIVILEFREPKNGDIVAALIDGETTLKRYSVRNGKITLKAENPEFGELLPTNELVIQGVMLGLLRRHKEHAA